MEIVLRVGPSAAALADDAIAEVASCEDALYLVRSEVRRLDLRARLLDGLARRGRAGAFELPFASVEEAALRFYRALPRDAPRAGLRLASPIERRVLLERILKEQAPSPHPVPEGRGRVFASVADRPGFVERLARFVRELGEAGIFEARDFLVRLPRLSSAKDRELAAVLDAYARALEARRAVDLERALAAVAASFGRLARAPRLVAIDGFYELPAGLRGFFRALARRAERTIVILEGEEGDPAIAPALAFWHGLGGRVEPRAAAEAGPRELAVIAAATPAAEVEEIARGVRERLDAAPGDGVAVAFSTIEPYAPIVREVFPRYGIPFALLNGLPLAASPVVRALFELLDAVESRFERAQVARAFLSPYVEFRGLRYDRLDRVAREARIAGPIGRAGWAERIEAHRHRLVGTLVGAHGCAPLPEDESPRARFERRRTARDLATIEREAPLLDAALGELESLAAPRSADEHERAVLGLLSTFEVTRRFLAGSAKDIVARDAAAERALVLVLREVTRGLASVGPRAAGPIALERYAAALRVALAGETFRVERPDAEGRVRVLGRLDVRGLGCDHLFFGGLTAGDFPGARTVDIFYDERDRAALGLATARGHDLEMRHVFAGALGGARRSACLSYPRDGTDGAANASPFLIGMETLGAHSRSPPQPQETRGPRRPLALHEEQIQLGRLLEMPLAAAPQDAVETAARAPAPLLRAVRAALSRDDPRGPGAFEGILEGAALEALHARAARRFGPTDLESYASCPFRAFAAKELLLAPLPEIEEEVGPREAGDLVHRVLRRFYEGFERGSGEAWLARARPRILEIAREETAAAAPAADVFWRTWRERLLAGLDADEARKGPLRIFLDLEAVTGADFRTVALERRLELEVGGAALAGVVDRVDVGPEGFVVYDYKTGRQAPEIRRVKEGRALQLPFYLVAMARELRDSRPLGAAYYAFFSGKKEPRLWFAAADAFGEGAPLGPATQQRGVLPDFDAALARAPAALEAAIAAWQGGLFHPGPAPPLEKGCAHCDYARVCRVDHARMEALANRGAARIFKPLPLVEGWGTRP